MATIVKPRSAPASADSDIETATDTPTVCRSANARVIKTSSQDDHAVPVSAAREVAEQEIAARKFASQGVAGKISGATIGKQANGNTGFVDFNLSDLVEQGRDQLARCQQQVEAMMEEARVEAEQLKQTAKFQGHAEGKQAAESEIEQRIAREAGAKAKAQVASLQTAVVQMKQTYDEWMQQYADVLTGTALAVAERLTRSQIRLPNSDEERFDAEPSDAKSSDAKSSADQDYRNDHAQNNDSDPSEHLIVRWAREALHSTRSASRLTLAVHPDTLAHLGRSLDELLAHPDLPEQSVVVPDETLSVGDIVVRQDGGEISAGLDAQLARLREELM